MKLKRYIFIFMVLVGVLVFPSRVRATDLKLTYNEDWNDCFRWVKALPSYDNNGNMDGYLFFGNQNTSSIVKHGLNNEIIYKKNGITSNLDVQLISSDLNERKSLLITGYDENDNVIFEKQYGGNGIDAEPEVINSYDNNGVLDGYLIVFITTSSDLGIEQGFTLLKVGLDGNIVWVKNFNEQFRLGGLLYAKNQSIYAIDVTNNTKLTSEDLFAGDVAWEKETGIKIYLL